MADIISLGEVLVDLTQTGTDAQGISQFAAFPGGAPANVAVAAARLGAKAGFIGKVGRDSFGRELKRTLEREGVDTAGVYDTDVSPTTLAIVSVDAAGERSFAFYRQPGADTQLTAEEALDILSRHPGILHFGSLSLTTEPARTAALTAVEYARKQGILISYDPNFRPALWSDEAEAVRWMKEPLSRVDVLKVSDEEMVMLTGTDDLESGSRILADYGIQLVLVTLGGEGVYYRLGEHAGKIPGVSVKVSDTNGAGDTFLGAMLCRISGMISGRISDMISGSRASDAASNVTPKLEAVIPEETLREFLAYANRAAAKTCSRPGAIPAMPTLEEMEAEK